MDGDNDGDNYDDDKADVDSLGPGLNLVPELVIIHGWEVVLVALDWKSSSKIDKIYGKNFIREYF